LAVFEPAVKVEELNPYVQGLSAAIKKTSNKTPRFMSRPGGSDGRFYAMVDNDIVEFGLYGKFSHSDREYVELSSFKEYHETLVKFLTKPVPDKLKEDPDAWDPPHLKLLRQLVEAQTISVNTTANNRLLKEISQYLAERGMHIHDYERDGVRSFVATTKPGNKRSKVLLSAHVDVVPAPDTMFKLTEKGDKLIGRGVMDMKFAVACYMALVDSLRYELQNYDFGIMMTSDEEVGSVKGVDMLVNEFDYRPEVVIVPDGGENWQLETFAKGVHWIKLTASGKSAHASRPWEGDSAIQSLLEALREIEALVPARTDPKETTLTIGTIDGGTMANQIPAKASAMLDIRYGSLADYKRLYPLIKAICRKYGVKTVVEAGHPPYSNDAKNPLIESFLDISSEVIGERPGTNLSYGVTDGRFFSAVGIPSVIIEPPAGDRHKDTEWLSRRGFNQFAVILDRYVRQTAVINDSAVLSKATDMAALTKLFSASSKPAYVWYATFGSGLYKENFMCGINGGKPEGSKRVLTGCRDKSAPLKDRFISLPHKLYFSGESKTWAGPLSVLDAKADPTAHTFARAYLITVEQFEDIVAQENLKTGPVRLPLTKAMRKDHATVEVGKDGLYDELLYCGQMEDYPVFSLTCSKPSNNYSAPSLVYTRVLCKGLSQYNELSPENAVEYLASTAGIAGAHEKKIIEKLFKESSNGKK
jgi:succinyl-diaminopimelate desuccinylase